MLQESQRISIRQAGPTKPSNLGEWLRSSGPNKPLMPGKKKLLRWGCIGLLLVLTSATVQNPDAPVVSSPLRFAFVDSMAPEARAALAKHIRDLDGVIGEWFNIDSG